MMNYISRVAGYQDVAGWFLTEEGRASVTLLSTLYFQSANWRRKYPEMLIPPTIWLAGNGGSAADAQHVAAELVGRFLDPKRSAINARALTVDTSILTAIGNDFGYDRLFARQLEAAGPTDILVTHSTSGESRNLLLALHDFPGAATVSILGSRARCEHSQVSQWHRERKHGGYGESNVIIYVPGVDGMSTQLGQMMLQHLAIEQMEERLRA